MIDEMIANIHCVNRSWFRMTTGLLRGQWAWLGAGFRTADKLLGPGLNRLSPPAWRGWPRKAWTTW